MNKYYAALKKAEKEFDDLNKRNRPEMAGYWLDSFWFKLVTATNWFAGNQDNRRDNWREHNSVQFMPTIRNRKTQIEHESFIIDARLRLAEYKKNR